MTNKEVADVLTQLTSVISDLDSTMDRLSTVVETQGREIGKIKATIDGYADKNKAAFEAIVKAREQSTQKTKDLNKALGNCR